MRVAILRCGHLPSFITWEIPDVEIYFEDDRRLIRAFESRGCEASSVAWSDPTIDWDDFDVALLRSTWDYIDHRDEFLDVLAQIERSSCRLFNPRDAVVWNSDKRYLLELRDRGIPTIPTFRASTANAAELQTRFTSHDWASAILKPTIGTAASDSYRVAAVEIVTELARLAVRHPTREYLIQPFVDAITTDGEWSFVFFDRELSHVLRKRPAAGDYRVQVLYGGSLELAAAEADDLREAEAVLAGLPFDVLYARLDLVRVEGRLAVMEIELIEPILSFDLAPDAADRLAGATLKRFAPSG